MECDSNENSPTQRREEVWGEVEGDFDVREVLQARAAGKDGIFEEKQQQQQAVQSPPAPATNTNTNTSQDEATTSNNNPPTANTPENNGARRQTSEEGRLDEENEGGGEYDDFDVMKVVALRAREALQERNEENAEEQANAEVEGNHNTMEDVQNNNNNNTNNSNHIFPNKRGVPYFAMDGREPGAYSGAPGASLHRCDDPRFSQVGIQHPTIDGQASSRDGSIKSTDSSTPSNRQTNSSSRGGTGREMQQRSIYSLVQANPIMEESSQNEELATAQPVENRAEQQQQQEEHNSHKERRWLWAGAALAILCLVVCISLVYGSDGRSNGEAPISIPSFAPSSNPSLAPTNYLDLLLPNLLNSTLGLEPLLENLPNSTLHNLDNLLTPQSKALLWMVSESVAIKDMEVWRMKQLFALATFFYSLEGPNWPEPIRNGWMDLSKPECYWFSSYDAFLGNDGKYHSFYDLEWSDEVYNEWNHTASAICDANGEFEHLSLGHLGLANHKPIIPPEIAFLTELEFLYLPNVSIATSLDSLMPMLFQLKSLRHIGLDHNNIKGTISSEFFMLTNLRDMLLNANALGGTIPTELGLMDSLEALDLSSNAFSGPLPSELGRLTKLSVLYIAETELNGTIPTQVGLMESLWILNLSNNSLTGPVPSELGILTNLLGLSFAGNALTGTIPQEVLSLEVNGSLFAQW